MLPNLLPLTVNEMPLAVAGGKGANLQRLVAAGFPVPPALVITTAGYQTFIEDNALLGAILTHCQTTQPTDPHSYEVASAAIRELFAQGTFPAALAHDITTAYAAWGTAVPVAVRSSATAEDLPEASFAGQQETYLNVRGAAALLEAVKRCWSSLWTARAMAYRAKQNIAPASVALAVVVQQMIPAEVAGVLFTLNPVTGNNTEMVLNATWGLGEALVSGQVNPDTFILDKASGDIKDAQKGDKAVMTATTEQGTAEVPVAEAQRQALALTPAQAAELVRLGRAIEAHFGTPQDIEWAIAGGQAHILQARAVTTVAPVVAPTPPGDDLWPPLLKEVPTQPFDVWTQADVGERWPEPVTPLTWSTWATMMNENMQMSLAEVRPAALKAVQWSKRLYGRIYFNEGGMMHLMSEEFGMPASSIAAGLGAQGEVDKTKDRWRWDVVFRRAPALVRAMQRMNWHVGVWEKDFGQVERWVNDFMRRDFSGLSDRALWAESLSVWRPRAMSRMAMHASITSLSMNNFTMLESLMDQWFKRKELAHTLITGLTGVVTAEIVPALRAMAAQLQALGLAEVVRQNPPAEALKQLRANPAAQPLLKLLDEFLQRHGHRCMSEAEWRYARWIETPEVVVEMMVGYLGEQAHAGDTTEAQRRREATTAELEAQLDPVRKAYLRWLLPRVQHLVRLRDNGQHYLVKLALPIRHIYALLAERWTQRGWLSKPDDFYFLVGEEIEAILTQGDPQLAHIDVASRVAQRRQAYDFWFSVTAPEVINAQGQVVKVAVAGTTATHSEEALVGIAASTGQVTGVARVVLNPHEANRLQPGEILVTRATDPGWTPVFSVIRGLVLEVGGLLSHGAIVAREYGLPAVVNVADATRLIEDGQTITVDGTAGRVYLKVEK